MRISIVCCIAGLLGLFPAVTHADCRADTGVAQYSGRYRIPDGSVLLIYLRGDKLIERPIFWSAEQWLVPTGVDRFVVHDRPNRQAAFERGPDGCIVAMTMSDNEADGRLEKIVSGEPLPVELLFDGRGREAAQMLLAAPGGIALARQFGEKITERFPSRAGEAAAFLGVLVDALPGDAGICFTLAEAFLRTGDRKNAALQYAKAAALDPARKDAARALQRLRGPEVTGGGWQLPFKLDDLFAPPARAEIAAVLADWRQRKLAPRDVRVEARADIMLGRAPAEIRIVSHRVFGAKHYGAIIVPKEAKPGSHPVLLDLKGVSWNYFPLDLNQPTGSMQVLAEDAERFIHVIPSFRGERLIFGNSTYLSEGDRTDVWDGATDDAIALLNVALKITPEADAGRIVAFGRSRGASVALQVAERDARVRRVVAVAGPADHFQLLSDDGWSPREAVAAGLREHSTPRDIGGQFIETFLAGAIAGERNLAETRRLLIASSPLYFAERLPRVQLHYGEDDGMVPPANGRALVARLTARKSGPPAESYFYPGFGHDTDRFAMETHARRFLMGIYTDPRTGEIPAR